jgi:hypothetical protein
MLANFFSRELCNDPSNAPVHTVGWGRPVLSFFASNHKEAQELTREAWLRADLFHHCLWDGKARLSVRPANDEEQIMLSRADKGAGDDHGILLAYLVAIEKTERQDRAQHHEGNNVQETHIGRSPPG